MIYTADDMHGFAGKAAHFVAARYRSYVEVDDLSQEIFLWLYGEGASKVERWLASDPQQTTRIYLSMLDVARLYAEREKAAKAGYRMDDIWWYTTDRIEDLLPLVLDPAFTQQNGHVGELLTMVIDIRKAIEDAGLWTYFVGATHDGSEEDHAQYQANLLAVLDRLGGERPAIGRRRAMTNAKAQAVTARLTDE